MDNFSYDYIRLRKVCDENKEENEEKKRLPVQKNSAGSNEFLWLYLKNDWRVWNETKEIDYTLIKGTNSRLSSQLGQ